MYLIFNIQKILFKKRIMTVTINFKEFSLNSDNSNNVRTLKKDTKPVNVYFLRSKREINKIKDFSKKISLKKIINLFIFMNTDENPLLQVCMNLIVNSNCNQYNVTRERNPLKNEYQIGVSKKTSWEFKNRNVPNTPQEEINALNGKVLRLGTILNVRNHTKLQFSSE